jgi:hypothetical protein
VKIIVLSDHTADQLRMREEERQLRHEGLMQEYEGRLRARQVRIDDAGEKRRAAWKERRYLQALGHAARIAWNRYRKAVESRARPVKEQPGAEDFIWRQGQEGEDSLTEFLSQTLDDQYIFVKGYKNAKGEIDGILLGPAGIHCMEVKNYKGTIHCDGDLWCRDKDDAWGNQVLFREQITDRAGRSPSVQLNESAERLEAFLRKVLPACKVSRHVIFTNEEACFGGLQDLTVDGVFLLRDWDPRDMLRLSTSRLTPRGVDTAVRRIERDHRYWEERRRARSASHPGRAA